jgi:hypothetical protein
VPSDVASCGKQVGRIGDDADRAIADFHPPQSLTAKEHKAVAAFTAMEGVPRRAPPHQRFSLGKAAPGIAPAFRSAPTRA